MKISNSKKELARIISENGGWREGADTCSCDHDGYVSFFVGNQTRNGGSWLDNGDCEYIGGTIATKYEKIKNWHQTTLSREEYFHLYPTPDADGWIEWKGGECPVEVGALIDVKYRDLHVQLGSKVGDRSAVEMYATTHWRNSGGAADIIAYRLHKQANPEFCESVMRSIPEPGAKPTIEQLAADYRNAKDYAERKQQEADAAKADADEMLRVLEIAGEALGLLVSPITERQEPELVITDWRDLQLNDIIEYVDGSIEDKIGMTGPVVEFAPDATDGMMVRMKCDNGPRKGRLGWPMKWRFIRRP